VTQSLPEQRVLVEILTTLTCGRRFELDGNFNMAKKENGPDGRDDMEEESTLLSRHFRLPHWGDDCTDCARPSCLDFIKNSRATLTRIGKLRYFNKPTSALSVYQGVVLDG